MVLALLGQTTMASAATGVAGQASPVAKAAPASAKSPSAKSPSAKRPSAKPLTLPKPRVPVTLLTKPVPPARTHLPARPSTGASARERVAAVRAALAHARTSASVCSGAVTPDTVYSCTTPSATGTDSYTLTLSQAPDLLLIRAQGTGGTALATTVTAPDGTALNCQASSWFQLPQCHTGQTGTYTVQVQNGGGAYTLSYLPLLSDAGCTVADPSFSTPTLQGSLAAGAAGACYSLAMPSGHVLHANSFSATGQNLLITVYDATGTQVCFDDTGDCPLTGTAPYRVLADDEYGNADPYALQLNDITQPQGCLAAEQGTYGSDPDGSSTDRCRTLQVATAGQYQVYAASLDQSGLAGTLYAADGSVACANSGPTCRLTAGTYEFVASPWLGSVAHFALVFIAANESRGCTATTDTGFSAGPATGTFTGVGEEICRTLPTASGKADYVFDQPTADGSAPQAQIVDATGAQQCPNASFTYATCALSGTAPFRVILFGQAPKGGYRLLSQRTDSQAGCGVWPQSGFGGSWGATVTLTPSSDVACLAIPAKQHSTGEMIDYVNNANVVDGATYVNDPTGTQVCVGNSASVCSYRTGVAYTALVITVAPKGDTYHLVRRDVSRTASCATPASLVPGGPSTTLLLTSALDARCLRVTGATADKYAFGVRALAPGQAGAVLQVADQNGAIVCWQSGPSCKVTGSTSYQVLVVAAGYQGVAITARVDTWRVGTAAGWAPQCTAHQLNGATGWKPFTVSMSESAAGYCAVVTVQPNEEFWLDTTAPSNGGTPEFGMESAAHWGNWPISMGLCNVFGGSGSGCLIPSSDPAGQDLMLVNPYQAPLPLSFSVQGVCSQECSSTPPPAVVTGISPAAGPSGSLNLVVVHGTNLTLATRIDLAQNGMNAANYAITYPVSLSADATALTVRLDTRAIAPGTYDVVEDGYGYSVGTPSTGYLPGAYRVTAGPAAPQSGTLVPLGPTRVLDTRTGLGAPKAHVLPGRSVRLQVLGGAAKVPTKGVTAVVLSVTAVGPTRSGAVTVYPDGTARPSVTDVSFGAGQTATSEVTVPVVNGRVDLANDSSGDLDLTADLAGYVTGVGTHAGFNPVGSARILNTWTGLGAPKARVGAGRTVPVTVDGRGGVPRSGVSAVVLNLTALAPTRAGALTAFGYGARRPNVTQLSFTAGVSTSGLVTVPVVNGRIDLYNGSTGTVGLTADVVGYYASTGSSFVGAGPVHVLDTRTGLGGSGESVLPHAAALLNVSNLPGCPGTVTAVVLSVTVTGARSGGALTVLPDGQLLGTGAMAPFAAGRTTTAQVVVPVVNGVVDLYNGSSGTVQVTADLEGYYAS
ncbi:hypothetical protein [Streptacidiphilus sp. MAP12-33]|uniref:hypothetical protein n=1 Tax=Streptacidiphilus sp. MAP12-33 TaxID=3156266 RepID=UPI0035160EA3